MNDFGRSFLDGSNDTNVYLWNMPIGHTSISTDKEFTKRHGPHLKVAIDALNQRGALCSIAGTASKDGSTAANTRVCNNRAADVLLFLFQKSNAVMSQFQLKDPIIEASDKNDPLPLWRGIRVRITTSGFFKSVSGRDPKAPEPLDIT